MKVLIAGCGDLGMRTATLLCQAGHEVIGLRRRPALQSDKNTANHATNHATDHATDHSAKLIAKTASKVMGQVDSPRGFTWLTGDLRDPSSMTSLPSDITHVIYAATPDQRLESAYRAIFLDGVQHLVKALDQASRQRASASAPSLQRFMFVSSSAVYGEHADQWVDELTPTDPQGFNGRILVEAEQWLVSQPFQSVVLRLSGIYGPGRDQLLDRIRHGQASVPRHDKHWSNRIHVEDAARALFHLMTLPHPDTTYLITDGHPYLMDELYDRLADLLGVTRPTEGSAPMMIGSKKLSNKRLLATGFKLNWPDALEGYAALMEPSSR